MSEPPAVPPTPSLPSRFESNAPSYVLPDLNLEVKVVPIGGMVWDFPADPPDEGEAA